MKKKKQTKQKTKNKVSACLKIVTLGRVCLITLFTKIVQK